MSNSMRAMHFIRFALLAGLLSAPPPAPLAAQTTQEWDGRRRHSTRAELEALLERLDLAARSGAYSESLRGWTRGEAALIRKRLEAGDFRIGDQVVLTVEAEPVLSDTFVVVPGPLLPLPVVGEVPLTGVLRSELEGRLREHLAKFIREPVVRATSLLRITVLGPGIAKPGFYTVPSEALLTDALTLAGGPSGTARLDRLRLEREGTNVLEGQRLELAIAEGQTLDQLGVRAGDRLVLPAIPQRSWYQNLRTVGALIALPAAIFGLTRLF